MKVKFLHPLFLFSIFIFLSCEDKNRDPLSEEYLQIRNNTDTTIYVYNGNPYDSTHLYQYTKTDSIRKENYTTIGLPDPKGRLWLTLSEFEQFVSNLKIYKIENKDTLFVKPVLYSSRNQWSTEFTRHTGGTLFYRDSSPFKITIDYTLTVTPEMFSK